MHKIIAFIIGLFVVVSANAACNPLSPDNKGLVIGKALHVETQTSWSFAAWWIVGADGDYWLCPIVVRNDYVVKHPAVPATASVQDRVAAYYAANVKPSCTSAEPDKAMLYACDAAWWAAEMTRPAPPYAVRANGSYLTRPTYPLVNGVRGTVSNGTVPIKDAAGRQTACDPRETLKSGTSTYMRVKGIAGTVSLCGAT